MYINCIRKEEKGRIVVEKICKEINNMKEVIRFPKCTEFLRWSEAVPFAVSATIVPIVPAPDDG
jgi:hypothetical protein